MRRLLFFCVIIFTFTDKICFTQIKPYINEIIDQVKSNANAYFLSANRPSYSVSSYMTPPSSLEGTTGIYFNRDVYEIPLDLSYGLSKKIELSGGVTVLTQSYNYLGEKVRGFGDSYLGLKYKFQSSELFDHVLQGVVKIPTASRTEQLGTGKFDFHFGLAEGFTYRNFSYDLSFSVSLLARRDFPKIGMKIPPELQKQLERLKALYNYRYEQEIGVSFVPSYNVSDYVLLYTGYAFTRNTRLDFNTSSILGGIGISLGKYVSLSSGGSFGLDKDSGWLAELSLSFLVSGKR